MAVEKMKLMNIVAPVECMHDILRELILSESAHIRNYTVNKVADSLTMTMLSKYEDPIRDSGRFTRYKAEKADFKIYEDKLEEISKLLKKEIPLKKTDSSKDIEQIRERIDQIHSALKPLGRDKDEHEREIREKEEFLENIENLRDMDIDIGEIRSMQHFNYHIGTLTKERRIKLRDNYENIPAIVLHIGSSSDGESYLIFSTKQDEEETSRILKSLNFKEIEFPENTEGRVRDVGNDVRERIDELKRRRESDIVVIEEIKEKYFEEIVELKSLLMLEKKIEELKSNVAWTRNFFYFVAWVSEGDYDDVSKRLETCCKHIIIEKIDSSEVEKELVPPTKLKNNKVIRPFELLVNMYGIPNYKEIDPTFFLGVTYLVLFGAMFGDVGQGLVFVLFGFLLSRKEASPYGEILKRIGISSTIFGFMYGSIFGNEEVLPALFVRPMEDINFVLYTAIGFGVILLLISFGMSMWNLKAQGREDEMFFGRDGLAGLIFYVSFLILLLQTVLKDTKVNEGILVGAMVLSLAMIFLRVPLYSKLKGQKPVYEEGASSYYIEGGFNLIETILSLLSNTISFIRVGAFALNHVGLFLAFTTMANMVNHRAMGLAILVLGNIIIIGLEGLIVLIQGLRLEYYELFGKYFRGDGQAFVPVSYMER